MRHYHSYKGKDHIASAIFMIIIGVFFTGLMVYVSMDHLGTLENGFIQRILDIINNVNVSPDERKQAIPYLLTIAFGAIFVVIGFLILLVKFFTRRAQVLHHLEVTLIIFHYLLSIGLFILSFQAITTDIKLIQYIHLVSHSQATNAQIVDHSIMPERTSYYYYENEQLIEYRSYPLFKVKYNVDGTEYQELLSGMETKVIGDFEEERNPSHATNLKEDLHIIYNTSFPSQISLQDDLLVRDLTTSDTPPDYQRFSLISLILVLLAFGTAYGSIKWTISRSRRTQAMLDKSQSNAENPAIPAQPMSSNTFPNDLGV